MERLIFDHWDSPWWASLTERSPEIIELSANFHDWWNFCLTLSKSSCERTLHCMQRDLKHAVASNSCLDVLFFGLLQVFTTHPFKLLSLLSMCMCVCVMRLLDACISCVFKYPHARIYRVHGRLKKSILQRILKEIRMRMRTNRSRSDFYFTHTDTHT